jgi:hypothetical protein
MSTTTLDPSAYQILNVGDVPKHYFDLIPQSAIRVTRFPLKSTHNAIWDFAATPEGRMYASLCNEFTGSSPAQLFEYLPETSELKFCFDTGVETLIGPREIPPSKIHTSINTMRDGRLIMATHTTSPSPVHKYWMFQNYYAHQWEGFPGSHVLIYDPRTGDVRTLGIPVPRDSIYGAIYDPRNHALWFNTFLKGHLWRMDLTTKELRDFGQITEMHAWSMARDTEGHIYTSSRSGHLWRVNVDTCVVEDLGKVASAPDETDPRHGQRVMAFHANGPDGRLYFTFHFSDYLYAIDPRSLKIERVGSLMPEGWSPGSMISGMGFDSRGRLWYGLIPAYNPFIGMHVKLIRWDLPGGGKPESAGLLGTPDRVSNHVSEAVMDTKNDIFHLADTNHMDDHPVMLAVDLKALERDWDQPRVPAMDAHPYMLFRDAATIHPDPKFSEKAATMHEFTEEMFTMDTVIGQELDTTIRAASIRAVRVWEHLGRGNGAVRALRWETDGTLRAWCGGREGALSQGVVIRDGKLESVVPLAGAGPEWTAPDVAGLSSLPAELATAKLPSRQGRRHLAKPSCWAPWNDGWTLVGTLDGMVAKVHPASGRVVALGVASPHGPVHQIVTNTERTRAFGVAGHKMDLGHVFYHDEEGGLREIGRTLAGVEGLGLVGNTEPCCAALSPDGKTLAIGALDELGSVYLYGEPVTQ